ncbi:hypothetical protein BJ170DRAFT_686294 [Xylariales sp. AK1849]|nr:hypothetical protein BJ170DRAFT_686294 [Xylariales sp. AK1849]
MDSKQAAYDSVSTKDDREELLSRTEVEDSLMDDEEKQWHSAKSRGKEQQKGFAAALFSHRWMISTFFQLVIICLLGVLLLRDQWHELETPQVGGAFMGNGPTFPTKIVKFDADRSIVPTNASEFFGDEILGKWKSLLPVGAGWGHLDTFSTTSMTHQLHCVFMMARIYAGLNSNATEKIPADYDSHFLHCIDYLRQGIMCSADLALEPHKPTDSEDNGPLDGSWGGHHVCKDYNHVMGYLEDQISDGARVVLPIDD